MNWQPRIGAIPQVYARNLYEMKNPKDMELLCSAMSFFVPREGAFVCEISKTGTIGTTSVLKAGITSLQASIQGSHVPDSRKHEKARRKLFIFTILLEPTTIYSNHVRVILSE